MWRTRQKTETTGTKNPHVREHAHIVSATYAGNSQHGQGSGVDLKTVAWYSKKISSTPDKNGQQNKLNTWWKKRGEKSGKQWEECQNTDSVFGTMWTTMVSKKLRKRPFFSEALFLHFSHVLPTWCPIPNAEKGTCLQEVLFPRIVGKGPTNETPSNPSMGVMAFHVFMLAQYIVERTIPSVFVAGLSS